jgi:hypothetical protein
MKKSRYRRPRNSLARIVPGPASKRHYAPKPDIMARLRADYGALALPDSAVEDAVREAGASHVERM